MDNNIKVHTYSKYNHQKLLEYLFKEYPYRSKDYLKWWLDLVAKDNINQQSRTFFIEIDDKIVGCTTSYTGKLLMKGVSKEFYWECNTIVSPSMRGKGVGSKIYQYMSNFMDRITVGLTDIAYKIQPKKIKFLKVLKPVNVYFFINPFNFMSFFSSHKELSNLPSKITLNKYHFILVNSAKDIPTPENGIWMNNEVEIIRDSDFMDKRYDRCFQKYIYYVVKDFRNEDVKGYVVFRKATLRGIPLMSLVDYRAKNKDTEKSIFKFSKHISKINGYALMIFLSSKKLPLFCYNIFLIRIKKKLNSVTTMQSLNSDTNMLITSADADLDFVYYE